MLHTAKLVFAYILFKNLGFYTIRQNKVNTLFFHFCTLYKNPDDMEIMKSL